LRRADRLFQIIQYLRTRRVTTARWLAEELEVSERTIYRDVQDLSLSGIPIEGEAGVGYALRRGFDLPPLMFTEQELTALTLGARIVKSWADPELARAAQSVLSKTETVLPECLKGRVDRTRLFSPLIRIHPDVATTMTKLRHAIDSRNKVSFDYTRQDGVGSTRTVWPLGLFFWGSLWTLGSWCELRDSFRNFRLDRIRNLSTRQEQFPHTPGRTLDDMIASEKRRAQCEGAAPDCK